ncbi:MAG: hypothetical protein KGJ90_07050 [Patescibacteria group bacterium]|nr:hypothetical protein [Patescibacteria group bacterium]
MSGTIFLEGKAVIVRAIDPEDNRYLVRFPDGTAVERYIDPMAQSPDVAFYVANLNDRKE